MLAVIGDLEQHVDGKSTASSNHEEDRQLTAEGAVACVGGRGPFDDVVAAMLAQLLAQQGVPSRSIPHALVAREAVAQLNLSDVGVIAVSCLELTGTPAHLRYLVRRLRQRAPDATLITGLWPSGDVVLNDSQAQTALGADHYVTSLRQAVDTALAARRAPSSPPALAK
jgi:methylmalonyl-CoA mutase cobalamin-binding subunit